jgi:hypothetical protein
MSDVVKVSTVETSQRLMSTIEEYFKSGRYAEITQAIGMYSIMIDSEHTLSDQRNLYRSVLTMIKSKLSGTLGKSYATWYEDFPKLLDHIIAPNRVVVDETAAGVLSSYRAAHGPFKSLDDFFFWCLDDRRLSLAQIVKYIETTAVPSSH